MEITFHNTNDEILDFPLHYSIRKRLTHMTSHANKSVYQKNILKEGTLQVQEKINIKSQYCAN